MIWRKYVLPFLGCVATLVFVYIFIVLLFSL